MTDQEPQTSNPISWFYAPTRPKADVRQMQYDSTDNASQQQYYLTTRTPPTPCQNPDATGNFAAPYVTMNFTGNYGNTAAGGCDADLYSRLILGDPNTQRPKGPQQLFERPWASTPFMSGQGAPQDKKDDESKLIQSLPVRQRKECSTVTDKFFPNQFDPLIPGVRNDIKDVNNWVHSDWVRGGDPTRIIRQKALNN